MDAAPIPTWRSSAKSPAIFLATAAALMVVAWALIRYLDNQRWPLFFFSVGAVIAFHLVACIFARLSDERTYKIVDYIYLVLGLFGLAAVLDVQSEIAKERLFKAGDRYAFYRAVRCEHPTSQRCANYTKQQEMMNRAGSDPNALQDMGWLHVDQKMPLIVEQLAGNAETSQNKILKEDLERFHFEWRELSRSEQSVQNKSRQDRFLPIYLLAVALTLRITKVSGELFKLHQPKQEPPRKPSSL